MSAIVTIEFIVPAGYRSGDYARLYGNGGSGDINWDTPLSNEVFSLFRQGAGIYGWGSAAWGRFRWGRAHSMRAAGWGLLSWGNFPWGYGAAVIRALHKVNTCGDYKFAFACYDRCGNLHEGTPEEAAVVVHIAPAAPTGLKKNTYNKETDILVLDAA